MSPLAMPDPAGGPPLVDRITAYVFHRRSLRVSLVLSLIDHLVAVVAVIAGWADIATAGLLVLLNLLTWFFAVALPVMNREVRAGLGADARTYWSEIVERFAQVVLLGETLLYSLALAWLLGSSGTL